MYHPEWLGLLEGRMAKSAVLKPAVLGVTDWNSEHKSFSPSGIPSKAGPENSRKKKNKNGKTKIVKKYLT